MKLFQYNITDVYLEPSQTTMIELYANIANGLGVNYFHKKLNNKCLTGF